MAKVFNMVGGGGGGGIKLASIAVTKQPDKLAYLPGERFDPAGMIVTATYSNGATMEATGYIWTPDGDLTEGATDVTIRYSEAGKTVTVIQKITVERETMEIPTQSGSLTYTGSQLSPVWNGYDPAKMVLGGVTSSTNAGTYQATFTPTAQYKWPDGSTAAKTVPWSIARAAGMVTLNPESVKLDTEHKSATVQITRLGDGAITTTTESGIISASVSGNTLTVTSVGEVTGNASVTVTAAQSENYESASSELPVTATFSFVYGVKIQIGNSNPETSVTYTDNAVGMTPGYEGWKDTPLFKNIKPCVVKNGVVQYYLNPKNLNQKADGSPSKIVGGDGDVMVEIQKLGYKITTDSEYHYISVTDAPNSPGYCYRAHSRDVEGDCDKLYIGAFLGYEYNRTNLWSLAEKPVTAQRTLSQTRAAANANGPGYELLSFYPLTLLQCLYLIMYKNLNSQEALGRGFVDGNSGKHVTGGTVAKGPCYGEQTGKEQMCFMNIEDLWGNLRQWIDGLYCDESFNIKTAFNGFNDTGAGYPFNEKFGVTNVSGWINNIQGTNECGFLIKTGNGSTSTYYADSGEIKNNSLCVFGGSYAIEDNSGIFHCYVTMKDDFSNDSTGARLVYKHKEVSA